MSAVLDRELYTVDILSSRVAVRDDEKADIKRSAEHLPTHELTGLGGLGASSPLARLGGIDVVFMIGAIPCKY